MEENGEFASLNMKNFWLHKTVLITGYEGFLGSNLTKRLLDLNASIIGLDIKVNRRQTILGAPDYRKIKVIRGSVADFGLLERIFRQNDIGIVFHLAAEAIVGKCNNNPLVTFNTNIKGTWNVLEACRGSRNKIRSIVTASSDKAYGACDILPYKENCALAGNHPYDASKSCSDLISQTYAHTYGLPVNVTRCGNIYGPGDFNFSRIIPDALRSLGKNKEFLIRSDGNFVRDYIYIEDVVNGYVLLAEKSKLLGLSGEAFNFSTNHPVTVIELLNKINKICLKNGRLKYRILNQARYEIKKQYLSSEKARKVLGWHPEYSLEEGLHKTADWYLRKSH